jgi:tripartite-type tricarboxylate transporter receptor subunit TctC
MPVKLIVGNPPGGAADPIARIVSAELSKAWKQPVIVENVSGAGGAIAISNLVRSAPDGHTLAVLNFSQLVFELLSKNPPYVLTRDTTTVGGIARLSNVLVSTPGLSAHTVAELVQYAKANPRKITYASGGYGSPAHLAGELFGLKTGTEMVHVPYKGAGPAIQDVIAGNVSIMFGSAAPALPQIETGKLRAMAVTGDKRLVKLPSVPTLAESGVDVVVRDFFGIIGPARLDPNARDRIEADLRAVLEQPDIRARIEALGSEIASGSAADFSSFLASERKKWADVISRAHITLT